MKIIMKEKKNTFEECCQYIERNTEKIDQITLLRLYSYYKQATKGDATGGRPSILKMRARTKYDKWADHSGMTKEKAQEKYIETVQEITFTGERTSFEDKHILAKEMLNKELNLEEYEEIKNLWKAHSIAEDNRDIEGLMATLTKDCRYEIPQVGKVYYNKEGAAQFYSDLLGAFPDIDFRLIQIYIGPQGVVEEAKVKATHEKDWLVLPATGKEVEFETAIFFPWDSKVKRFKGERVYFNFDRKFYRKYGMVPPFPELKD
jgi:acyl-CoA-binding protein/predicted ester cyclase